ncbi:hypothetical protein MMC07_009855 [Pseudocyphellaria aurata]|nr:hypothetical protein [Pseudocyphellaria aurata]
MSGKSSEIVIGVDFGTTHSGVSWAVNGGSKRINLINNWPDPSATNDSQDKVPSSISYLDGKPQKWGYNVGPTDESLCWIKILLEETREYVKTVKAVQDCHRLLGKIHKTAQEVVADYLKLLWDYTIEEICKKHPDYESIYALRVVLTVPAIWSPKARDKTLQAAKLAGMPNDIELVTEPEAAALATLRDKAEEDLLEVGSFNVRGAGNPGLMVSEMQVGDAFVVCDAGGGTVDLISYEVERLSPLKIKECAIGSGGLCGSVFLDLAFAQYIETIVGEAQYNRIKEKNRKKMMKEFEFGIKRAFDGNDDQYSVDLRGVKDDRKNGILNDTIKINRDALIAVFDRVTQQIQKLVADQIAEVEENRLTVKAILLVGGFGANRWSSICRGATLWGLEHPTPESSSSATSSPTVTSRLSRYSYGMCLALIYNSSEHTMEEMYFDQHWGAFMAPRQMEWLLKRGEEVKEGRELSFNWTELVEVGSQDSGLKFFSTDLYYCEEPKPPTRWTNVVRSLCTVKYGASCDQLKRDESLRSKYTMIEYHQARFDFRMLLGNAGFHFEVFHHNERVGHVETEYAEKFA